MKLMTRKEVKDKEHISEKKQIERVKKLKKQEKELSNSVTKAESHFSDTKEKLIEEKICLYNEISALAREKDSLELQIKNEISPITVKEEELRIQKEQYYLDNYNLDIKLQDIENQESVLSRREKENAIILKEIKLEKDNIIKETKKKSDIDKYIKSEYDKLLVSQNDFKKSKENKEQIIAKLRRAVSLDQVNVIARDSILKTREQDLEKRLARVANKEIRLDSLIKKYGK